MEHRLTSLTLSTVHGQKSEWIMTLNMFTLNIHDLPAVSSRRACRALSGVSISMVSNPIPQYKTKQNHKSQITIY